MCTTNTPLIKQVLLYESMGSFIEALNLIEKLIYSDESNKKVYIHGIYLIYHILRAGDNNMSMEDYSNLENKYKNWFDFSFQSYSNDAEYLFFVGHLLDFLEYYVGYPEKGTSIKMVKRAFHLDKENLLYKWSFFLLRGWYKKSDKIAKQIVAYNTQILNSLAQEGLPGQTISETLLSRASEVVSK